MADDEGRDAVDLGHLHQATGALAHLADRAGGRFEGGGVDGLDRVDHEEGRLEFSHPVEDRFQSGLGEEIKVFGLDSEALAAQFDLPGRFLGGDVEDWTALGETVDRLQQQGRFADPGITADEDEGAGDDPAAEDAVELGDAAANAVGLARHHLFQALGAGEGGRRSRGAATRRNGHRFFGETVPGAAIGALAEPFRGLKAALLAGKESFLFHDRQCMLPAGACQREERGPLLFQRSRSSC